MAFDSKCKFLILGTRVGTLHALDIAHEAAGKPGMLSFKISRFRVSRRGVTCITFEPGKNWQRPQFFVSTSDCSVARIDCIHDSAHGITNLLVRERFKVVHTQLPLQNCYCPSGAGFLVSGSEDNDVYIYSLEDGKLQKLSLHKAPVMTVAVDAGGMVLASGDMTGTLALWRRSTSTNKLGVG
eukprot:gnl/MRDRNA2_/MRDRNA2_247286_c0_seq1.p1 gnl/MRDRNA2_/MRDRNA2_247286_c0~~gnl/MRDRNA2_/MRDRNA2_247286_c0_seq1.p1  ORF type:complete len:206 (-),score=22.50 gnl/MRDRNA2_/MRDRNA2_247286_c0_seq1:10-558(-)